MKYLVGIGVLLGAMAFSTSLASAAIQTITFESGVTEGAFVGVRGPLGGVTANFDNTAIFARYGAPVYGFYGPNNAADTLNAGHLEGLTPGNWFAADPLGTGSNAYSVPGTINVVFSAPVYDVSFYALDVNQNGLETLTATISMGTTLVATKTLHNSPSQGDGWAQLVAFGSTTGIDKLTISVAIPSGGAVGWGIDNVSFNPVPEPVSLLVWSVIGGLGLVGAWWRRRKAA